MPYDRLSISSYMRCHCGEVPQYLLDDGTKAPNQFGTSKWNAATRGPVTLEIKVRGPPIRLGKYALKSANDAPGRDPKTWDLIAVCADGSERVVHAIGSHDRKWPGRWTKKWGKSSHVKPSSSESLSGGNACGVVGLRFCLASSFLNSNSSS